MIPASAAPTRTSFRKSTPTPTPTSMLSSPLVLLLSFLLLLTTNVSITFAANANANAKPAPYNLTPAQITAFRKDGVIVVRGMLDGEVLEDAIKAVHKIQRSTGLSQRILHKMFPSYRNMSFQTYRKHKALKKVAFDSTAPTICAKLMGLDDDDDNDEEHTQENNIAGGRQRQRQQPRSLRLLKDAVLGFSKGDKGCGWHVDDKMFWPCEDSHQDNNNDNDNDSNASSSSSSSSKKATSAAYRKDAGVNVWIALSPTTAEEGGGLAVAPGTHDPSGTGRIGRLAQKARNAIAIASNGAGSTCILEMVEPECNAEMEQIKRVYDMQPGDAIVHDRYLFHKPDAFKENDNGHNDNEKTFTKQRISLRYMPSDATFFNTGVDGAATQKNLKTGDPLWKAGEYFPQTWPCELEEERKANTKQDRNPFSAKLLFTLLTKERQINKASKKN